jgi:hypothetical protein
MFIAVSLMSSEFSNDELLNSNTMARWRLRKCGGSRKGYPLLRYYLEATQQCADVSANFVQRINIPNSGIANII